MGTAEILIVDDNEDDVDLALRALKIAGVNSQVDVCRSGSEALDFFFGRGTYAGRDLTEQPRLVLLDLKLGAVSGLEVLEAIRSSPALAKLVVVMLTSSSLRRDMDAAYKTGANSYLVKSPDFRQFIQDVRQMAAYWLDPNRQSPPKEPTGGD